MHKSQAKLELINKLQDITPHEYNQLGVFRFFKISSYLKLGRFISRIWSIILNKSLALALVALLKHLLSKSRVSKCCLSKNSACLSLTVWFRAHFLKIHNNKPVIHFFHESLRSLTIINIYFSLKLK